MKYNPKDASPPLLADGWFDATTIQLILDTIGRHFPSAGHGLL